MLRYDDRFGSVLAILGALVLSACTVSAPRHQDSGIEPSPAWSRIGSGVTAGHEAPLASTSETEVEQQWWKRFEDPVLDELVAEALEHNRDLAAAKARVLEARALHAQARSARLPDVSVAASAERGNLGYLSADRTVTLSEADVVASWDLDLMGGRRAREAQSLALLQSEEASRQGVRVALLGEVGRSYFELRGALRQLELTRQNLVSQQRTLELTQAQRVGALTSDFDVERAAAQVSATAAEVPMLETVRDAALNRLAVLLGKPPGEGDAELLGSLQEMPSLTSEILVAAPARVLAARPDIRAAERTYAANLSAKDEATAQLFPDISLTALFGAQSYPGLHAVPWNVAVGLVAPVLNFGRIRAQIDAADARQQGAFLAYQQTVLDALQDMENALSSYGHEAERNTILASGVTQNRRAAQLARSQYTNGYAGLLDVLVAERNLLDAESAQASSDIGLRRDLVAIYSAAGGAWE